MFKKSLLILSLVTPLLLAQTAQAREFGEIYTDCGLGGIVGKQISDKQVGNVAAIVTNILTTFGAIAIISEVSSPETCAGGSASIAMFIHQTYDALEHDIASGQGEYLTALKSLSAADDGFEEKLRVAFTNKVASSDYENLSHYSKSEALYNIVHEII